MINYDKVSEKVFAIIKGHGHKIVMFTPDGRETSDPKEARRFFVAEPNYMVTVDEDNREIKLNKNKHIDLDTLASIMKQLKNLATSYMLKSQVKVFGQQITPKDYAYQAKQYKDKGKDMDELSEAALSRMYGSTKTSYQTLESVKIVARHRTAVDEDVRGSRSRRISAIFLEQNGERRRFPHNCLPCARAMARHMHEGGSFEDVIGQYIIESSGNLIKLNEFMRYAKTNKLINENSEDVVALVRENVFDLKRQLGKLTGAKTYHSVKESIKESEGAIDEDTDELKELFTVRKFDEKMSEVLPLVKKFVVEKQAWKDKLVETSKTPFLVKRTTELSEADVLEFDNPIQKMGYRLRSIAERAVTENDLSKFMNRVAGKLIEGIELNKFEKTIIKNVLENAQEVDEEDETEVEVEECGDVIEGLTESLAAKLDKYTSDDIFRK
jgi:hypothetical protein